MTYVWVHCNTEQEAATCFANLRSLGVQCWRSFAMVLVDPWVADILCSAPTHDDACVLLKDVLEDTALSAIEATYRLGGREAMLAMIYPG